MGRRRRLSPPAVAHDRDASRPNQARAETVARSFDRGDDRLVQVRPLLIGDGFVQRGVEALARHPEALEAPDAQDLPETMPAQRDALDPGMRLECRRQVVEGAIELVEQREEGVDHRRACLLTIG